MRNTCATTDDQKPCRKKAKEYRLIVFDQAVYLCEKHAAELGDLVTEQQKQASLFPESAREPQAPKRQA